MRKGLIYSNKGFFKERSILEVRAQCTLFSLLILFLMSCGASQPDATSFIFSDTNFLTFMTFQSGADSTVSGSWYKDTADKAGSTFIRVNYALTGKRNESSFSFSVAGLLHLEGSANGNSMKVSLADDQGRAVTQEWVAAPRETYDRLVSAFEAFWQVRFKLAALSSLLSYLPVNSDPGTVHYQDIGAEQRVDSLKSTWAAIQAESDVCRSLSSLKGYYPLSVATVFSLPDPRKSDLALGIAGVNDTWNYAQRQSIPNVSGPSLAWKLSREDLVKELQPATSAFSQLEKASIQAGKDMQPIKQEYDQIAGQIEPELQRCGVTLS